MEEEATAPSAKEGGGVLPTPTTTTEQDEEEPPSEEEVKKKHHIVLLGDSILDNRSYVIHDGPSVIEQLQFKIKDQGLPWKATLCAVDGAIISGVKRQLERGLPEDTTAIVLSIGGNNGLGELGRIQSMGSKFYNPINAYSEITAFCADFRVRYANNLDLVISHANEHCASPPIPLIVLNIYFPLFDGYFEKLLANVGLTFVNNIILEEAQKRGLPVIDIASIFNSPQDYANPIEPGVPGGDKITANIIKIIKEGGLHKGHVVYKYNEYSSLGVMYATKKQEEKEEKDEKSQEQVLKEEEKRRDRLRGEEDRSVEDNEVFRHS